MSIRPKEARAEEMKRLAELGWQIRTEEHATFAWQTTSTGCVVGKGWSFTRNNPDWHYGFKDDRQFAIHVNSWLQTVASAHQVKTAQAADRAQKRQISASSVYAVGDVLYTSWGYDQTNVEWYQVTQVGTRSICVRRIAANCSDNGGPCGGRTAPRRGEFVGPEHKRILNASNGVKDPQYGHHLSKWDGSAKHCSSYA